MQSTPKDPGRETLVRGVLDGDRLSAARLMRLVDDRTDGHEEALDALFGHTGRAHVIGLAGSPGCGKSTLADGLIETFRHRGRSVGIVAVDPSSSLTGGAILGDRVRMQRHAADDGVFIRSVATRGAVGGLSSSTQDIARIMDAMGRDVIIIETVGVGQDEVEIASVAHTVAVVLSPDTGDAVQIMKAGIIEIGDLFVVNKADRQGADRVAKELALFFQLQSIENPPAVIETVATSGTGLEALADALEDHHQHEDPGERRDRMRAEIRRRIAERVTERLEQELAVAVEASLDSIEAGRSTPYATVRTLYETFSGGQS
jgi:LAO/AO transport system kinase